MILYFSIHDDPDHITRGWVRVTNAFAAANDKAIVKIAAQEGFDVDPEPDDYETTADESPTTLDQLRAYLRTVTNVP